MNAADTAPTSTWPPDARPSPTLARCLLLAGLLHGLVVVVVGSAPAGSARVGEGVFGALNVTLRGPPSLSDGGGGSSTEATRGPPGDSRNPRWGGRVRDAATAPVVADQPGAARLGTWSPTGVDLLAGPEELRPWTPVVTEPQATPTARVELAPATDLAPPAAATQPSPEEPLPRLAQPAPRAPRAIVVPEPKVDPSHAPMLPMPAVVIDRAAERPPAPPPLTGPVAVPSSKPMPVPVPVAEPVPQAMPVPAPAPPAAAATAPVPTPTAAPSEEPTNAPATSPAPTARPSVAPLWADSVPATGSPEAGARLGHDLATPPAAPSSAPRLNLELPRARGGEISGQGSRGLLPLMPRPAETKSKLERDLEKASQPDCRQAYAGMGLLAAVPLVADALKDKGCRW